MLVYMPNFESEHFFEILLCMLIILIVLSLVFFNCLYDSPRNLALQGKDSEAYVILKEMIYRYNQYEINKEEFNMIKDFYLSGDNSQYEVSNSNHNNTKTKTNTNIFVIFNKSTRRLSILLIFIWLFNSVITYGSLLIYTETLKNLHLINDQNIIISIIIIGLIASMNAFIFPLLIEYKLFSIKNMMVLCYIFSFLFSLLMFLRPSNFIIWNSFFLFFIESAFNLSTTYTAIVYPTKIRDNVIGFMFSITRIGGFLSQYLFLGLFNVYMFLPYYLQSGILFIMIFLCYFLNFNFFGDERLDREFQYCEKDYE